MAAMAGSWSSYTCPSKTNTIASSAAVCEPAIAMFLKESDLTPYRKVSPGFNADDEQFEVSRLASKDLRSAQFHGPAAWAPPTTEYAQSGRSLPGWHSFSLCLRAWVLHQTARGL